MTKVSAHHLVWMDLEMTGLVLKANRILEIATVITDYNLDILAEGPIIAIHQSEEELSKMDAWNTKHHTRSGLVERVRLSTMTEKMAELETLNFLKAWVPAGKSPMCGNSICQDRRFLAEYMPTLEQYFHYRNLDVSTLKELAKYWKPTIVKLFKKKSAHLAMADIKESINELKHYRDMFLAL